MSLQRIVFLVLQVLVFDRDDEALKLYINARLKAQSTSATGPTASNLPRKHLYYKILSNGICSSQCVAYK